MSGKSLVVVELKKFEHLDGRIEEYIFLGPVKTPRSPRGCGVRIAFDRVEQAIEALMRAQAIHETQQADGSATV
jgi:hypothetical protein